MVLHFGEHITVQYVGNISAGESNLIFEEVWIQAALVWHSARQRPFFEIRLPILLTYGQFVP